MTNLTININRTRSMLHFSSKFVRKYLGGLMILTKLFQLLGVYDETSATALAVGCSGRLVYTLAVSALG